MHTIAVIICLITLPIVLLLYFTASKQQHAKRMRASGCTYRVIAQRLGVSQTTARNYCLP
jgi:DNA-binding NarL/FixJ family response regulator